MAYTPTSTVADLPLIVGDILGEFGIQIAGFAGLIVLVIIVAWLVKESKGIMRGF